MTIAEAREKCKSRLAKIPQDAFILSVLVLISLASFGLGYLAGLDEAEARKVRLNTVPIAAATDSRLPTGQQVVASKNGTKYYPAGCAGAERISDANKVWFTSAAAAVNAGYAPAANCK